MPAMLKRLASIVSTPVRFIKQAMEAIIRLPKKFKSNSASQSTPSNVHNAVFPSPPPGLSPAEDSPPWFHDFASPTTTLSSFTDSTERVHVSAMDRPFSRPASPTQSSPHFNEIQTLQRWLSEWTYTIPESSDIPSWQLAQVTTIPLAKLEVSMRYIIPRWEGEAMDETPPGVTYERREMRWEPWMDDREDDGWIYEDLGSAPRIYMEPVNARFRNTVDGV
jgi:hypothetical protein